jgi:hypothetical protein
MRTLPRRLSRATLIAALLVSVLALAAAAGGTVSYDSFSVSPDGEQANFFYTVTGDGAPDVERVLFQVGACFEVVDAGTWGDGYVLTPGGGQPEPGCESGVCGVVFNEDIVGAGAVANYYFTLEFAEGYGDGEFASSLHTVNAIVYSGGQQNKQHLPGPLCKPTAVAVSELSATAAGLPLAALGGMALAALGAGAAVLRRRLIR